MNSSEFERLVQSDEFMRIVSSKAFGRLFDSGQFERVSQLMANAKFMSAVAELRQQ
jgi:hypothetical protein